MIRYTVLSIYHTIFIFAVWERWLIYDYKTECSFVYLIIFITQLGIQMYKRSNSINIVTAIIQNENTCNWDLYMNVVNSTTSLMLKLTWEIILSYIGKYICILRGKVNSNHNTLSQLSHFGNPNKSISVRFRRREDCRRVRSSWLLCSVLQQQIHSSLHIRYIVTGLLV